MDVYLVIERYEDEVSPVVFGSDEQAKLHLRQRRDSYLADIEDPVDLVTDEASHVYTSTAGGKSGPRSWPFGRGAIRRRS